MVVPRPDDPVSWPAPIVFFGSPPFAVPTLRALAEDDRYDVRLVVSQPPRPVGRGRAVQPSAVHAAADNLGLPVFTPERLRGEHVLNTLTAVNPALFVVAAYGKILRPDVLALPSHGTLNVHASLLPTYRGASPITAAILDGIAETGVTIMLMDVGLDTGPILTQVRVPIASAATTASLTEDLATVGATLLRETAARWLKREIDPLAQDDARATITRLIAKEDGAVDWHKPAAYIARMERAYTPWPRVFTWWDDMRLILHQLSARPTSTSDMSAGTILRVDNDGLHISTGDGELVVARVQPEGKGAMPAEAFARGHPEIVRARLGTATA